MELISGDGADSDSAAVFRFADNGASPGRGPKRAATGNSRKLVTGSAGRVLILGRLRELALYRAEILRQHGFIVFSPESEPEALAIIEDANFDVAVLSYTLPDDEVKRFVDLIRAHCNDCRIVAIAQTMQHDRRIEPDSVVLGEKGPAELLAALHRLLHPA